MEKMSYKELYSILKKHKKEIPPGISRLKKAEIIAILKEKGYSTREDALMHKIEMLSEMVSELTASDNITTETIIRLKIENRSLLDVAEIQDKQISELIEAFDKIAIKSERQQPPEIQDTDIDELKCPVCLNNKSNTALGCTHVLCSDCYSQLDICPICRERIYIKTYFRV